MNLLVKVLTAPSMLCAAQRKGCVLICKIPQVLQSGIGDSEGLPSVLFFQIESLITILSLNLIRINNMAITHHFLVVWHVSPKYNLRLWVNVYVFCPDKLSYTDLSRLLLNSFKCRYPKPQPQPPPHSVHSTLNLASHPLSHLFQWQDIHPLATKFPTLDCSPRALDLQNISSYSVLLPFQLHLGANNLDKGQQNKHGASNEETWVEAPVTPLTRLVNGLDKVILHSSKILNAHSLLVKIHYFFIYLFMQQLVSV